jgi:hypothetical protein
MVHGAVFGVSFATLAFEVLLARLFAISQWHHLSFMVISIALFGFAASGSFLSRMDLQRWAPAARASDSTPIAVFSLLCSASMLLAFAGLVHLPLDYFRLALEPVQWLYLLAVYLLLALPFFFAGAVIALAYVLRPQQPGHVYFASMTGSALGAAAPVALLAPVGEVAMVALSALVPLAAVLWGAPAVLRKQRPSKRFGRRRLALALIWGMTCAVAAWFLTPEASERLQPRSSEYKMLSQVLQFPETRVLESIAGIRGRIEHVHSPHLRFAPGLSLKYTDPLPPADALFIDRDQPFFLYDPKPGGDPGFAPFTLSFLGYELLDSPGRVLLIMGNGGLAVGCAQASGARQVRIVQPDPNLAERIARHYGFAQVERATPRAFLARTTDEFDLIHLESWGSSLPGADALHQDHLLTVEGLTACLRRLDERGGLVVTRRLLLPPSASLRLWASMREALTRIGEREPERCMAMLRNWDTMVLLATRGPIPDPQRILEFARRLNFDVLHLHGAAETDANRFNVFDEPYHFREIRRLENAVRAATPREFFSAYLLDVEPRTDLQPFPASHLKWDRVGELYRSLGSRLPAFFLSGEVMVAVVFIEALAVAGVLLLLPALPGSDRGRIGGRYQVLYFFGIGAGFILAELFFIHVGTFLLGDPVISLAVVLSALLVSSGAGGLWAQRRGPAAMPAALLAAAGALLLAGAGLWLCSQQLLALPEFWRYAALAAGTMIPGFALGAPFPLGMRFLLQRPAERAFAWAVNGSASVLASVAAAQIAVSAGLHWILGAALAGYALAFWSALCMTGRRRIRPDRPGPESGSIAA